jgi:hypothetical protein
MSKNKLFRVFRASGGIRTPDHLSTPDYKSGGMDHYPTLAKFYFKKQTTKKTGTFWGSSLKFVVKIYLTFHWNLYTIIFPRCALLEGHNRHLHRNAGFGWVDM